MTETQDYLNHQVEALNKIELHQVVKIAESINQVAQSGGKIWIAGNGGSATTAAHCATDLSKGVFSNTGVQIPAICLNEMVGVSTAWSNDINFKFALKLQMESLYTLGDLVLVFSGSGNSENILELINFANTKNLKTIGIGGMGGGQMSKISSESLIIQSEDMQIIENTHLYVVHLIYKILSEKLVS